MTRIHPTRKEGRMTRTSTDPKWRIACINWSHEAAPHAVAYYIDGERLHDHYFPTWAEAVTWVDKITQIPRQAA